MAKMASCTSEDEWEQLLNELREYSIRVSVVDDNDDSFSQGSEI